MIYSVLKQKYNILKPVGNNNNHIGLPLTILKLKDHDALILEMGMNHLGEISTLSKIAKPNIAVITNVGTAHIGNLGSRENILKAKLEIVDGLDEDGILFFNNDNDLLHENIEKINKLTKISTIGINNTSDFMAKNIEDEVFSSKFYINDYPIEVNVGGIPFIYNSLMAFAIGKYLNIDENDIAKGIKDFKLESNRLEKIISKKDSLIINDTYNASLDSVIAAIDLICKTKYKRKIILFGDILELGVFSKDIHSKIAEYIIENKIDYTILVGNEVKYVKEVFDKKNYDKYVLFNKAEDTFEYIYNLITKDDILLIKGSHGMNLISVVNYLKK